MHSKEVLNYFTVFALFMLLQYTQQKHHSFLQLLPIPLQSPVRSHLIFKVPVAYLRGLQICLTITNQQKNYYLQHWLRDRRYHYGVRFSRTENTQLKGFAKAVALTFCKWNTQCEKQQCNSYF